MAYTLIQELMKAAQTTRSALDYGDQEWVSRLFLKAADELEAAEARLSLTEQANKKLVWGLRRIKALTGEWRNIAEASRVIADQTLFDAAHPEEALDRQPSPTVSEAMDEINEAVKVAKPQPSEETKT